MNASVSKNKDYFNKPFSGYNMFSHFQLFSVVSIVIILFVAGLGLRHILRKLIIREAEKDAIRISKVARDCELHQYLELHKNGRDKILRIPVTELPKIDRSINLFTEAFDIAKIKIYNVESQVIYSTETKIIGEQDPHNKSLLTALAGTPISKYESKDKVWDLESEEHLDIDTIETYVPIYSPDGVIIGSFEIYKDIAKDLRMADNILIRSWSVLAVTVLGVFGILTFVIHHAVKTIKVSTDNLMKTNERLQHEMADRKRLEKEILGIVERERQKIGQELHDSVGQQLTGVAFMAEKLGKKLSNKSLTEEIKYAERIETCVSLAAEQTRSLAKGLHPIDLDRNGLIKAIEELAANTEKLFHISCVTKYEKNISISDITLAINLYRITQEAINNAIKHGKAKNIRIELATTNSHLKLTVENDGLDFSTERSNGKGMGLRVMQYRAESINGSLDIRKSANGGTVITCVLPKKEHP